MFATAGSAMAANIVQTAEQAGSFTTLLAAAQAAGLADALSGPGPLTVFAPTDEAFAALPEGTVENLLKPENKDQLVAVLSYHVVGSQITSDMIAEGTTEVETLKASGDRAIMVTRTAAGVTVDGATVVSADIRADNGVIHVIDKVILPSD
nr:fasciclin domain-containing protein [Polymorphum gilvum]